MKFAMSLIAVAGIAAAANAATTLAWEASTDGGATWSSAVNANPGDSVRLRLKVSLNYDINVGPERGESGFAGINVLPSLSNFNPGDTVAALSNEFTPEGSSGNPFGTRTYGAGNLTVANAYFDPALSLTVTQLNSFSGGAAFNGAGVPRGAAPGGVIASQVGGFGRQAPFAANGTAGNGVPTSSVVANVLQWRAAVISNGGVSFAQQPQGNSNITAFVVQGRGTAGTTDDQRSSSARTVGSSYPVGVGDLGEDFLGLTNIVLFEYGITLGSDGAARTLVQSSTSLIPAKWFTNSSGSTSVEDQAVTTGATISIVPAPGALALLGLGGLVAGRRRR